MGAFEVKNRSDALRSTISLNSGLVLSDGCVSEPVISSGSAAMSVGVTLVGLSLALFFIGDGQATVRLDRLVVPLALELDAQPQLVLRIGVAQRILVGDVTALVEIE